MSHYSSSSLQNTATFLSRHVKNDFKCTGTKLLFPKGELHQTVNMFTFNIQRWSGCVRSPCKCKRGFVQHVQNVIGNTICPTVSFSLSRASFELDDCTDATCYEWILQAWPESRVGFSLRHVLRMETNLITKWTNVAFFKCNMTQFSSQVIL